MIAESAEVAVADKIFNVLDRVNSCAAQHYGEIWLKAYRRHWEGDFLGEILLSAVQTFEQD
jgi:hypothetical protein